MDLRVLLERLRQLLAVDKNAYDIYTHLQALAQEEELKTQFKELAQDESRHVRLEQELVSLFELKK